MPAPSAPGARLRLLVRHAWRFALVGGVAWVVDVLVFNLLRSASWSPLQGEPVAAKVVSVAVSTVVAWFGNRTFTFERAAGHALHREIALFALFSAGGLVIATGTLWFSHDVLGLRSALADNVSANVVGFGLATAFRFVTYRRYVFGHR